MMTLLNACCSHFQTWCGMGCAGRSCAPY